MITQLARRLFGSHNERVLRLQNKTIAAINALEPSFKALSDDQLKAKTIEFRARLAKGETLDDLLPEAFATVREAAWRVLGQRPFDVQLRGGMVLHSGKISEMRTGEGKTLVATLPVYLNGLSGKGVHVVTVNDYLASRDSGWMGQIYRFLGLSVGCIVHGLSDDERREAYAADITYGTNNEFGFDYLRDNMKFAPEELVQRPFNYAIVDEVDSILIDEARTPLIISGPAEDSSELYVKVDALIPLLTAEDYEKDEKQKTIALTELGNEKMEQVLAEHDLLSPGSKSLYDGANIMVVHHVNQALRAHKMFTRDVDYIVKGGKVIIIDEFTGRMMEGRRFSDGLHQALEAKEKVQIQRENQTLASITFQNYFRMYPKLAGMTGTALTEAAEFAEIYGLEVVVVPTNIPAKRLDMDDEVYGTMAEKYEAIADMIEECKKRRQPVLVGTVSIEKSEQLSDILKKRKIAHHVLNARYHEQEATIIAQAGALDAVTIATNMAGRGTDIQLGGNVEMRVAQELSGIDDEAERARRIAEIKAEVEIAREEAKKVGGLFVIGTERHESRRIDNQLRGRSGRQGDPGASKFYLSLEDDLMRIFGSERMENVLTRLGLKNGEKIAHPWISTALEKAQQKVEARNFDIRKNLLKFDNVVNDQRKVVYEQRREIMNADNVGDMIKDLREDVIQTMVATAIPPHAYPEQWDLEGLEERVRDILALDLPIKKWGHEDGIAEDEMMDRIEKAASEKMAAKTAMITPEAMARAEKAALLSVLDQTWKDHLLALDQLRQGIHLRGYGQKDPFNEYSRESFALFQHMMAYIREQVTRLLMRAEIRLPTLEEYIASKEKEMRELHGLSDDEIAADGMSGEGAARTLARSPVHIAFDPHNPDTWHNTSRNAPCPCGSGKKYKHCHGAVK